MRRLLCAVLIVFLLCVNAEFAAAKPGSARPIGPDPVYSGLAHGAITMASNSVVTCAGHVCAPDEANVNASAWVKVDPKAPGNTASSARLDIPAGAKVLHARLYWQLNPDGATTKQSGDRGKADQVAIKVPGKSTYQRLSADTYDWLPAQTATTAHAGVKDVTALVSDAGSGDYTVADIQACAGLSKDEGLGCWGGWSLVVAYEQASDPLRYLQMWDGFQTVDGGASKGTSAVINLAGLKAASSHTPKATMGIVAGDGDAGINGDYLEFGPDQTSLTRLKLPGPGGVSTVNAFASRIDTVGSNGVGSNITTRNPSPINNSGYDARTIDVTGKVLPGATKLAVKVGTQGDFIFPQSLWLATDASEPDLRITARNNPSGQVAPGSEITYSFDVANKQADGSAKDLDTATNVVLATKLPAGLSYLPGSNQNCSAKGQDVTCVLPDFAPGAAHRVDFKVSVGATVKGGANLDAAAALTFKGKGTGRTQSRTTAKLRNTVVVVGYELTAGVDKANAQPGDPLTYTVVVRNTGKALAKGVVISGKLPTGTRFVSATGSKGTTAGNGPVTWTVGDLGVNESATLTVTATAGQAAVNQVLMAEFAASGGPGATVPQANQCHGNSKAACAATTVSTVPYTVKKSADRASANPGDRVTYTIVVQNTGSAAGDFAVTDDLSGLLGQAVYNGDAKATQGTAAYSTPKLTFNTGRVGPGQTASLTYSVTVNKPVTGNHHLSTVVTSVTPGGSCPSGSSNPACTTVTPVSDMEVSRTASKTNPQPGDVVTYTVVVKNTGQTPLTGAKHTDNLSTLGDKVEYQDDVKASSGAVNYAAPKLDWTGNLPIGGSATITYSVKVKDPHTDPKIVKSSTGNTAPGGTVMYTVTIVNVGQAILTGPTLVDDLRGVTYNGDANATRGTIGYAEPKLTWQGDLQPGEQAEITYSAKVDDSKVGAEADPRHGLAFTGAIAVPALVISALALLAGGLVLRGLGRRRRGER